MSWGALFMYYHCKDCGKKYKYDSGLIPEFGDDFGRCPDCHGEGVYESEGAISTNDNEYPEVSE